MGRSRRVFTAAIFFFSGPAAVGQTIDSGTVDQLSTLNSFRTGLGLTLGEFDRAEFGRFVVADSFETVDANGNTKTDQGTTSVDYGVIGGVFRSCNLYHFSEDKPRRCVGLEDRELGLAADYVLVSSLSHFRPSYRLIAVDGADAVPLAVDREFTSLRLGLGGEIRGIGQTRGGVYAWALGELAATYSESAFEFGGDPSVEAAFREANPDLFSESGAWALTPGLSLGVDLIAPLVPDQNVAVKRATAYFYGRSRVEGAIRFPYQVSGEEDLGDAFAHWSGQWKVAFGRVFHRDIDGESFINKYALESSAAFRTATITHGIAGDAEPEDGALEFSTVALSLCGFLSNELYPGAGSSLALGANYRFSGDVESEGVDALSITADLDIEF